MTVATERLAVLPAAMDLPALSTTRADLAVLREIRPTVSAQRLLVGAAAADWFALLAEGAGLGTANVVAAVADAFSLNRCRQRSLSAALRTDRRKDHL